MEIHRSRLAATAFVLCQLAIPAGLFVFAEGRFPADFSWDMFSYRVRCERLDVYARAAEGPVTAVDLRSVVPTAAALRRTLYPERLEQLRTFLCNTIRLRGAPPVEVAVVARCTTRPAGLATVLSDGRQRRCSSRSAER